MAQFDPKQLDKGGTAPSGQELPSSSLPPPGGGDGEIVQVREYLANAQPGYPGDQPHHDGTQPIYNDMFGGRVDENPTLRRDLAEVVSAEERRDDMIVTPLLSGSIVPRAEAVVLDGTGASSVTSGGVANSLPSEERLSAAFSDVRGKPPASSTMQSVRDSLAGARAFMSLRGGPSNVPGQSLRNAERGGYYGSPGGHLYPPGGPYPYLAQQRADAQDLGACTLGGAKPRTQRVTFPDNQGRSSFVPVPGAPAPVTTLAGAGRAYTSSPLVKLSVPDPRAVQEREQFLQNEPCRGGNRGQTKHWPQVANRDEALGEVDGAIGQSHPDPTSNYDEPAPPLSKADAAMLRGIGAGSITSGGVTYPPSYGRKLNVAHSGVREAPPPSLNLHGIGDTFDGPSALMDIPNNLNRQVTEMAHQLEQMKVQEQHATQQLQRERIRAEFQNQVIETLQFEKAQLQQQVYDLHQELGMVREQNKQIPRLQAESQAKTEENKALSNQLQELIRSTQHMVDTKDLTSLEKGPVPLTSQQGEVRLNSFIGEPHLSQDPAQQTMSLQMARPTTEKNISSVDPLKELTAGRYQPPVGRQPYLSEIQRTETACQTRGPDFQACPLGTSHDHIVPGRPLGPQRKEIKPDKFTGGDWPSFIAQFERISRHNQWDTEGDEVMVTHLLSCLDGAPKEYMKAYTLRVKTLTYSTAVNVLQSKYAPPDLRERYVIEFMGRKQKPGESLDDFATSLQGLGAKAFPNTPDEVLDDDIVHCFREGILDPTLKQKIWEAMPITSSLDEYLTCGRRFQIAKEIFEEPKQEVRTPAYVGHVGAEKAPAGSEGKPRKRRSRSSGANPEPTAPGFTENKSLGAWQDQHEQKLHTLEWKIDHLNSALVNLAPQERRASSLGRHDLCYRCGSRDHWIRNCPVPDTRGPQRGDNDRTSRGGGNSSGRGRGYRRGSGRREQGGGRNINRNKTDGDMAPQAQPGWEEARAAPIQSPPVSQAVQMSSPGNA